VFYPRSRLDAIYRNPCPEDEPQGWYTGTPYGPVDLLPVEAPARIMAGYGALVFLGWNSVREQELRKLLAYVKPKVSNPVFISPDIGAAYMVKKVGGVSMEKTLGDYVHGPVTFRQIIEEKLDFDVTGRDVILIDDMIIAGETMIRAAQVCKKGGAKRIICAAVHGLLVSCAFDKIRAAGAKEIVVSDSILGPAAVVSVKRRLTDYLP
jgi:phosphoribosylpyrophosphate synthetase